MRSKVCGRACFGMTFRYLDVSFSMRNTKHGSVAYEAARAADAAILGSPSLLTYPCLE